MHRTVTLLAAALLLGAAVLILLDPRAVPAENVPPARVTPTPATARTFESVRATEAVSRTASPLPLPNPQDFLTLTILSAAGERLQAVEVEWDAAELVGPHADGRWSLRRPKPLDGSTVTLHARGHLPATLDSNTLALDSAEVTLELAIRLEVEVQGPQAGPGWHVQVRFPDTMAARNTISRRPSFHSYPGIPDPSSPAVFHGRWNGGGNWDLAIPPGGTAAIDRLPEGGVVEVVLFRLGEYIDSREVLLPEAGGLVHVGFTPREEYATRSLQVVNQQGQPLAGVEVVLQPRQDGREPHYGYTTLGRLPIVRAASLETNSQGTVVLPVPDDQQQLVLFRAQGLADTVRTFAELGDRLTLEPGRTVILNLLGADGQALIGGWSTGGANYSPPHVYLGHGVWRESSWGDHSAAKREDLKQTEWLLTELPSGTVLIRIGDMGDFEFRLDTTLRRAECIAPLSASDISYGK